MFLKSINEKIEEHIAKKEVANKNQDFKLATDCREEARHLQEYLTQHKK